MDIHDSHQAHEYAGETSCPARRETMRMTAAERIAANRRPVGPVVRLAIAWRVPPAAMARSSLGFAVIGAVWLSRGSVRDDGVALAAAIAVFVAIDAGRVLGQESDAPVVEWGLTACALLAELFVYAGMAAGVSLRAVSAAPSGPAGQALRGTFVAGLGGAGTAGVWRLAVIAVMLAVLVPMVDVCLHGPAARAAGTRIFGPPGDVRLPLAVTAVLLGGIRAGFGVVLVLGAAALGATIVESTRPGWRPVEVRGYRGDGRISVWIGAWVRGRIPPLAPLFVGLLVTGSLTALGLRNLPGILLLTPVEAMLLASFGSWHPHGGRGDWLVPPLIQAAEYVFLAEAGFAGHQWPPMTFALVAAAGFRHLDLAYRARAGLASGIDRRGLGWEGRMIVVGIAAATGGLVVVYPALTIYLWWLNLRDWTIGWTVAQPGHV
jgi:hypothetical protein